MSDQVISKMKDNEDMIAGVNSLKEDILLRRFNAIQLEGVPFNKGNSGDMPVYSGRLSGNLRIIYIDRGGRICEEVGTGGTYVCRDLVFLAICNSDNQNAADHVNNRLRLSKIRPFYE